MTVNSKRLIKSHSSKKDKGKYHRPEGAGNFDNMDDKNIVNQINVLTGTVENAPTDNKNIVNKEYVDDIYINVDGGNSTGNFGGIALSPMDGGNA